MIDRYAAAIVVLAALVSCVWVLDPAGRFRAGVRERPRRVVIRPLSPVARIPDTCELVEAVPEEGPGFLWGRTRVTRQRCMFVLPRRCRS